jgi:hypothetical protein
MCANCNWGNDPIGAFCRHCGSQLPSIASGGLPAGTTPTPPSAQVPRPRRAPRRSLWILLAVLMVSVLVINGGLLVRTFGGKDFGLGLSLGLGNATPSAGPSARPVLLQGTALPLDAVAPLASSSEDDASAGYLIDGRPDTYWAANPTEENPDPFPTLTFNLKAPGGARVVRLLLASGGLPADYQGRPRPKDICVRVDGGNCVSHQLLDQPDSQEVRVEAGDPIRQVQLQIRSVYPPTEPGAAQHNVTMREVTLFAAP